MNAILTPCVKICVLNPDGTLCTGCGRTLREIQDWRQMSDEQRRTIMARLASHIPRDSFPSPGGAKKTNK